MFRIEREEHHWYFDIRVPGGYVTLFRIRRRTPLKVAIREGDHIVLTETRHRSDPKRRFVPHGQNIPWLTETRRIPVSEYDWTDRD